MADVSWTAANVVSSNPVQLVEAFAGEAIIAGQPVRIDTSDRQQVLLSRATSVEEAKCCGIAANTAATDQIVYYFSNQSIGYGAGVFDKGETYVVSPTNDGGIAPESDLGSGHSSTTLGIATSTSTLKCQLHESGVLIP